MTNDRKPFRDWMCAGYEQLGCGFERIWLLPRRQERKPGFLRDMTSPCAQEKKRSLEVVSVLSMLSRPKAYLALMAIATVLEEYPISSSMILFSLLT